MPLSLRALLILVLGISVVAAIPVSPMTSSIHRRGFGETVRGQLGMVPKPLPRPATEDEAKQRINGLWSTEIHDPSPPHSALTVHVKIANGELEGLTPATPSVSKLLKANDLVGLRPADNRQPQFRNDVLSMWGNVHRGCPKGKLSVAIGVVGVTGGTSPPYYLCVPIKDQWLSRELGI